jgi:hypothetical protein
MSTKRTLILVAGALLASTTGCIHVSQRAIDNGRAMTSSGAYRDVMSGNVNNASLRKLYYRSNARLMYARDLPYAPFGTW